jgi:hypothetical protein
LLWGFILIKLVIELVIQIVIILTPLRFGLWRLLLNLLLDRLRL